MQAGWHAAESSVHAWRGVMSNNATLFHFKPFTNTRHPMKGNSMFQGLIGAHFPVSSLIRWGL